MTAPTPPTPTPTPTPTPESPTPTQPTSLAETAVAVYKAATAAEREKLVAEARSLMTPVLTDHLGNVVLDPATLATEETRLRDRMVVFAAGGVFFHVRNGEVRVVRRDAGQWVSISEPVKSLVDVGKALA